MSNSNSQEQTIYRSLAGKIQLGFYDDGERFPSAKEIAAYYQVSYCPAQRALKILEKEGLIELCRGRATTVLKKPYENYLENDLFRQRSAALLDLCKCMKLISPVICLHGMYNIDPSALPAFPQSGKADAHYGRYLYLIFDQILQTLGSQTALSLYYDFNAFTGSAFLDILHTSLASSDSGSLLYDAALEYRNCIQTCRQFPPVQTYERLKRLSNIFYERIEDYLEHLPAVSDCDTASSFDWEPRKGRTRYCDVVAIDMVCKINQGIYPAGTLLPNGAALADIYHISEITVRRTILLLSRMGIVKTLNGVGTRVISTGDSTLPYKLKELMLDDNLKVFLEALQLITVTIDPVLRNTFPYLTPDSLKALEDAASGRPEKKSLVAAISAGMQAVVRCCPLAAVRNIYSKLTLLLLKGSILRLEETGEEQVPGWDKLSALLLEGCKAEDGAKLAGAFRRLFEQIFNSTKISLLEIKVNDVEKVTGFPPFPEDSPGYLTGTAAPQEVSPQET